MVELKVEFERLRAKYARNLPARAAELRRALEAASSSAGDEHLRQVRALAHKLRGSAGSYNFGEIGEIAAKIEDTVLAINRQPDGNPNAFEELTLAASQLETQARDAVVAVDTGAALGAAHAADEPQSISISAPSQKPGPVSRLLIVGGDKDFAARIACAAERGLVKPIVAATLDEAVKVAQDNPVAAVIINVASTGNAQLGIETAKRLREPIPMQSLPFAFIFGDAALDAQIVATHVGASLFLTCPVADQEIVNAIRQLVSEAKRKQQRVLIVDDDEDFSEALRLQLVGEGFEVSVLSEPEHVIHALDTQRPDALLLDVVIPKLNGLELCRIVRATPRWQLLPVLMMTSFANEEGRVAAFEAGADDYLLKPVVQRELLARIRLRVKHARLVEQRLGRDSVTGMIARDVFVEAATTRLNEAARRGEAMSLALIDVGSRSSNGPAARGDMQRIPWALGRAILVSLRQCDLQGRWSDSRFAVALPCASATAAKEILSRLAAYLQNNTGDCGDTGGVPLPFCAGVSSFPRDGASFERLLASAASRLLAAQQQGEGTILID